MLNPGEGPLVELRGSQQMGQAVDALHEIIVTQRIREAAVSRGTERLSRYEGNSRFIEHQLGQGHRALGSPSGQRPAESTLERGEGGAGTLRLRVAVARDVSPPFCPA